MIKGADNQEYEFIQEADSARYISLDDWSKNVPIGQEDIMSRYMVG